MLLTNMQHTRIILPERNREAIIMHCRQTLEALARTGTGERKAFGLIGGSVSDTVITVAHCLPLFRNVRSRFPFKDHMDKVMAEHAVPSETPLEQRGWVADPAELLAGVKEIRRHGHTLLGTYHMHRVAWSHDPVRDTPTRLDTVLAEKSRLAMFIVSMVEPSRPVVRAFYEGIKAKELPIVRPERRDNCT